MDLLAKLMLLGFYDSLTDYMRYMRRTTFQLSLQSSEVPYSATGDKTTATKNKRPSNTNLVYVDHWPCCCGKGSTLGYTVFAQQTDTLPIPLNTQVLQRIYVQCW